MITVLSVSESKVNCFYSITILFSTVPSLYRYKSGIFGVATTILPNISVTLIKCLELLEKLITASLLIIESQLPTMLLSIQSNLPDNHVFININSS